MQGKELFLVGADRSGLGCGDDRRLQAIGRLKWERPAPYEEFVVDILWRERVKGKPRIASKISTLG
jgi:hypothetical protein